MEKSFRLLAGVLLLIIMMLSACDKSIEVYGSAQLVTGRETQLTWTEQFHEKIIQEITISSVGDVLIHQPVYLDAWTGSDYNFYPMLEKIAPHLSSATITTVNQESMIGGEAIGLSSYPTFNSPQQ